MTDYPEMKGIFWTCIVALVLLLSYVTAKADNRLAISSTAILADSLTTYMGIRQGAQERNPILGRHPSAGKQALFAGLKLGINWAVLTHTSEPTRKVWFYSIVIVEGAATTNNLIVLHRNW